MRTALCPKQKPSTSTNCNAHANGHWIASSHTHKLHTFRRVQIKHLPKMIREVNVDYCSNKTNTKGKRNRLPDAAAKWQKNLDSIL